MTVCSIAPPSDHEFIRSGIPSRSWASGADNVWVEPIAHQNVWGASISVPSTSIRSPDGAVVTVTRSSVRNVAV